MKPDFSNHSNYKTLLNQISSTFTNHKNKAVTLVNTQMLIAYWHIGQYIVEFEQLGNIKAEYGKYLLIQLSKDLKIELGKGFSRSNLYQMRNFYLVFPIVQTVSGQLSWSHYIELLGISDKLERSFYEQQTILEKWSVRELKRQKKTALFQRLALSKDKKAILEISKKGNLIQTADDLYKDPYIFEFLGLPEDNLFSESELENRLINKLQQFLLELGKGFAFVRQQYRITLNNRHFRVDLVFYHYILKCFVLIDLKVDKIQHYDIGQMNMYINYFKTEENQSNDNEPIGIILTTDKDDILVEYATGGITNQLFVSKYQVYLPDKEVLKREVQKILTENSEL
jgi:predicted nuclease of restriction endonuclease-like (RecB) superfamily